MANNRLAASFRDPSGFLFRREGILYRQINKVYEPQFKQLVDSGLYERLVKAGLLVPHEVVTLPPEEPSKGSLVIRPELIPFISYPYEWSFRQYKDAALGTLRITREALQSGMILKDASAYNIQFLRGQPVLIDTLSFDNYEEGQPWVAYRQFCQHFLAPLALMSLCDVRLSQLMRVYIDGVPLDLTSKLLPRRSRLNFGLLSHIHLHAGAQKRYAGQAVSTTTSGRSMSKMAMLAWIDSLENAVKSLKWEPAGTEWAEYYDITNYSDQAFDLKKNLVSKYLDMVAPKEVWDLGANTGVFSRLASERGIPTVSFDIDPAAVDRNYRESRDKKESGVLPLVLDLTNPSPGIGWQNRERAALLERGPVDLVMALAIIHHLAISNNLPLTDLAAGFAEMGRHLIIEFVPKSDSQVQKLLASRVDIFPDYTREGFEKAFATVFDLITYESISGSERILYLYKVKDKYSS